MNFEKISNNSKAWQLEKFHYRYWNLASEKIIIDAHNDIKHNLEHYGLNFEDKDLPISIVPTVLLAEEIKGLSKNTQIICKILKKIISNFRNNHRNGYFDSFYHRFFAPYYKWWNLIAKEERRLPDIMLMRFDAIKEHEGPWKLIETNTCCPGGVIHCARIRDAWKMTQLGYHLLKQEKVTTFGFDNAHFFVSQLADFAAKLNPDSPNIAVLNFKGTYSNELQSLKRCFYELKERGKIKDGEFLLGDIRDVTVREDQAYLNNTPLSIIYNKLDPLAIDPEDQDIRGWILASQSHKTDFLNSIGAMYLSEAKRVLAFLTNENWNSVLELSEEEVLAINSLIPKTFLIEDYLQQFDLQSLLREKNRIVLKADTLTRGQGVSLGNQEDSNSWELLVKKTRNNHGVIQTKCSIPTRVGVRVLDGTPKYIDEYYGIDIFMFNENMEGFVSRSHLNQIFNIGNGGCESPVLILGEKNEN